MSSRRHQAREVVLQMLFQKDLNPDVSAGMIRDQIQELLDNNEQLCRFAWSLFAGTVESLKAIDKKIESVAANWKLSRMPPTDRNAIRLGAFELLYTDTPHPVVIDEALELAKSFGSAQSASFVNGILDKLVPESKRKSVPANPESRSESLGSGNV
ncbi:MULTISPECIES: transcription antitermination factor NusB [unclassified Schlesneria]|uniref:transcription antitermination factor NusB n=1 Tax=Schlesneria TaxID=656899 RepID=UPI002EEA0AC5